VQDLKTTIRPKEDNCFRGNESRRRAEKKKSGGRGGKTGQIPTNKNKKKRPRNKNSEGGVTWGGDGKNE